MKACFIVISLAVATATTVQVSAAGSPVSKVLEMLADLQAKIIKEGEAAQKTYDEFSNWCEDRSKSVGFEIKSGQSELAELSAAIEKEAAKITSLGTKIEELSGSIAKDEADLKAATKIRSSEAADFATEEKESKEVISTLERAIAVLSRDAAKGAASMLQQKDTQNVAKALAAMVQASVLSSADANRLTALVQSSQESDNSDGDAATGAPDPSVYKGHNDGIIGTLEDLLEKAEGQLETARKTETTNRHHFEMLKQSLSDEIDAGSKDMADAKQSLAAAEEAKATAEGDAAVTKADVDEDKATLSSLHQDCTIGAQDFQAEAKSRGEELKALAQAKKILSEQFDAAASFLQVARSQLATSADLARFEVIRLIRDLARKEKSVVLSQLASKLSSTIKFGTADGSDPLTKVKSMVSEMIAKLEKEAQADASQQAFCDKETSETTSKKDEKVRDIEKLGTKIGSMVAKSAKLKEETATLQKELGEIAASQADMDKLRLEEKALFEANKAEMEAGIAAVQKALSVLRDYYSNSGDDHGAAKDAGAGIISMLEVVESDFTKGLTEMQVTESTAVTEYEKTSQMNIMTKATKDKDLKYKSKEAAGLDKSVAETSSDKDGVQAELDALLEYLAKLGNMCIAKPESYGERKAKREEEIKGLKQALATIEGEAVLLQRTSKRAFRGKHLRA